MKCEAREKHRIIRSLSGPNMCGVREGGLQSSAVMSRYQLPSESAVRASKSELESGKQCILLRLKVENKIG